MTARTWLRVAAVVLATIILQVGVLNGLVLGGAHVDAFLVLAIAAGLAAGPQRGAVMAFVIGLVADLFVLTPFGLSSLVYVLVAFGAGAAASVPSGRAHYSFRLVVALAGGIGGTILFAIVDDLLGQPRLPGHQLAVVAAVVGLGCVILIIPATAALSWAVTVGPPRDVAAVSSGSAAR